MKGGVKVKDKGWIARERIIREIAAERKKEVVVGILAASASKPKTLTDKQKDRYRTKQATLRARIAPIREAKIAALAAGDKEAHAMASAYLSYGRQKLKANATSRKAAQSALSVLQIAQWIEFGTETQPARPVIRGYTDKYGAALRKWMGTAVKEAYQAKIPPTQILPRLGVVAVGGMQQFISNDGEGTYPGNAESTLRAKKPKTTPNVNTGQYRSSITSAVRERGK